MQLIVDFESTGLLMPTSSDIKLQPYIIEVGYLLVNDDLEVLKEFSSLIKPPCSLDPKITKITKITNEDLKDAPCFSEVWQKVKGDFESCTKIVAHNVFFDFNLLKYNLMRYNLDIAFLNKISSNAICTATALKDLYGFIPSLEFVYKDLIDPNYKEKHRALDDCTDLLEIYKKLCFMNL